MTDEKLMSSSEVLQLRYAVDELRKQLKAPAKEFKTSRVEEEIAAADLRRAVKCARKLQKLVYRVEMALARCERRF